MKPIGKNLFWSTMCLMVVVINYSLIHKMYIMGFILDYRLIDKHVQYVGWPMMFAFVVLIISWCNMGILKSEYGKKLYFKELTAILKKWWYWILSLLSGVFIANFFLALYRPEMIYRKVHFGTNVYTGWWITVIVAFIGAILTSTLLHRKIRKLR